MKGYRHVERGTYSGIEWMQSRSASPRGLVIVPPLIGGHALQQLRLLRPLVRRRLDLMSFNYAGHGGSAGAFSLQASLDNSFAALELAMGKSRKEGVPLYGLASCFAALPLIQTAYQYGEPLSKIVLINALPNLRWENMVVEFIRYWRYRYHWRPTIRNLKAAMKAYRDELLPNVSHEHQAFGILSRHRVKWAQSLRDLITFRHIQTEPLRSTPVLCIYGRQDRFLRQFGFSSWKGYETLIKSLCHQVRFSSFDGDHFLRGTDLRRRLFRKVGRFLVVD